MNFNDKRMFFYGCLALIFVVMCVLFYYNKKSKVDTQSEIKRVEHHDIQPQPDDDITLENNDDGEEEILL